MWLPSGIASLLPWNLSVLIPVWIPVHSTWYQDLKLHNWIVSLEKLRNSFQNYRSETSIINLILNYPSTIHTSALKDAFSDQWFLLERLTAREKEKGLAKNVLEGIDQQVKCMLVNTHIIMTPTAFM